MAKKNVIAYFLHENEQADAIGAMSDTESTESFVIGQIEESEIEGLRQNRGHLFGNTEIDCLAPVTVVY